MREPHGETGESAWASGTISSTRKRAAGLYTIIAIKLGKSLLLFGITLGIYSLLGEDVRWEFERFLRVHRSHIVNIERVVRLKRAGDNGVVELDAADAYAVPVSRSRVGWLKSRMGSKPSEVAHQSP